MVSDMDAIAFSAVIVSVLVLVAVYVLIKTKGDKDTLLEYWQREGKGAVASAMLAIVVIGAIGALLAFSSNAKAGEWFQYTDVYMGIDYTKNQSPQCRDNSLDDRLTSNLGIRQHVYAFTDNVDLLANYTHHSCVVGRDQNGYDGVGVQINWRFNW